MGRLEGKAAIVTGGAQGIGGATARRLAEEGARVLIADIDVAMAETNAERIRAGGGEADVVRVDVGKRSDIEMMVRRAVGQMGTLGHPLQQCLRCLDCIDRERGGPDGRSVGRQDERAPQVHIPRAKYAIPEMRKVGGGSIVNTSSVHGMFGAPGVLIYETAKHAVIGATRQMATEYGPDGIRVNAVLPGHMLTERLREHVWKDNPSGLEFFKNQYPLRDVGRAEDIANAVLFLCSDEASFITGHPLVVDGGLTIQLQENFGVRQAHYLRDNPDTMLPY